MFYNEQLAVIIGKYVEWNGLMQENLEICLKDYDHCNSVTWHENHLTS